MSLLKVFIISCISGVLVFVLLFNSFNKININNNTQQQAAIDMIYDSNK